MIFENKEDTKCYCATCGKEILLGAMLAFSSTKSGTLKIHHKRCSDANVSNDEVAQ